MSCIGPKSTPDRGLLLRTPGAATSLPMPEHRSFTYRRLAVVGAWAPHRDEAAYAHAARRLGLASRVFDVLHWTPADQGTGRTAAGSRHRALRPRPDSLHPRRAAARLRPAGAPLPAPHRRDVARRPAGAAGRAWNWPASAARSTSRTPRSANGIATRACRSCGFCRRGWRRNAISRRPIRARIRLRRVVRRVGPVPVPLAGARGGGGGVPAAGARRRVEARGGRRFPSSGPPVHGRRLAQVIAGAAVSLGASALAGAGCRLRLGVRPDVAHHGMRWCLCRRLRPGNRTVGRAGRALPLVSLAGRMCRAGASIARRSRRAAAPWRNAAGRMRWRTTPTISACGCCSTARNTRCASAARTSL